MSLINIFFKKIYILLGRKKKKVKINFDGLKEKMAAFHHFLQTKSTHDPFLVSSHISSRSIFLFTSTKHKPNKENAKYTWSTTHQVIDCD